MSHQAALDLPADSAPPGPAFCAPEPHSAADPTAIADWADDQARARLAEFMAIMQDKPLDVLATAIRAACDRGFGIWMVPEEFCKRPHHRPGTHMVEIALFGAPGTGLSLIEAARSWRIAATELLQEVAQ
jgi:hypothetical protein